VKKDTTVEKPEYITYLNSTIYPWVEKRIGYKRKNSFSTIDFDKHWISLFRPVIPQLVFESMVNAAYSSMFSYWPLILIWALQNNPTFIVYYALLHLLLMVLLALSSYTYTIGMQNLSTNFEYNISRFFLTSDPIHHATKSSGQITSKVNRAKSALEPLAGMISFAILPTILELVTVAAGFFVISWVVGLYITISVSVLLVFFILSRRFLYSPLLKWSYKYSDALSATNLEVLQQQNYIRTTMSSDIMMSKIGTMSKKIISVSTTRRFGQNAYIIMVRLFWFLSFAGLLLLIFRLDLFNSNPTLTSGLLIAYIGNANSFNRLANMINNIYERSVEVDDLYDYIHGFGDNSYPVI
jgi:ABC-type multidrug transport system fused ATPase/permease subunit